LLTANIVHKRTIVERFRWDKGIGIM